MTIQPRSAADHDLAALQMRVLRRRQQHVRIAHLSSTFTTTITVYVRRLLDHLRTLPARYALHLFIGMFVPVAIIASQVPLAPWSADAPTTRAPATDPADLVAQV